jgi:predicted ATPase/DNA-binding SARP family transcriptional activator/tetratricopeptide (TPR) repeat protein
MVVVRLLGPVDVVDTSGAVHSPDSALRRTLLALLAMRAGEVLTMDWLLEHAWGGEPPESGQPALRFHISRLRKELGDNVVIETRDGGYRLAVTADEVDAHAIEELTRSARLEADRALAADMYADVLAMWRGAPFVGVSPCAVLDDEAGRLEELRLAITEEYLQARLDMGAGRELVADLSRATAQNPLRESLWSMLITAQYRAGLQADALRSYEEMRAMLADSLGLDPSSELQDLQRRVLQQDPSLLGKQTRSSEFALLLWDVEASTGLLVRRGQEGVATLGRAAELVAEAARGHGGQVSTSQGESDGAVVLFSSVARAVAASVEVNRRMSQESWPEGERVAVRGAVHIGTVTATPEGVFGLEVHHCALLRALAGGGDVLLSDAAARTLGRDLPVDASLVDEGPTLLRGSVEPDRVWRLVHPALRTRSGPVLGIAESPMELPVWRTSFVGRSAEMEHVAARLGAGRVVTLVGPGGVGKTRLAAAVAAATPVRACFVDLTRATSAGEVDAVAAEALGADPAVLPRTGVEAVLLAAPALIVLDNCEHVLDAAASLVEHLLDRCAASFVLATSRAALRVPGEDVVIVEPLPTAPGGAATQLFIDRSPTAQRAITTNDTAMAEIDAVIALLDGVPLAIELAAARLTAFTVSEILALLQHDVAGLGDDRRRGPERHRTVRASIEWSMGMLSGDERRLLCRLAVLPGSFRLSTAIAASDTGDGRAVVAAMPSLVEQSLVSTEHRAGSTRYRLLEMIRAVGQEALSVDERNGVLDRLLMHCLDELDGLDGHVFPEPGMEAEIARDSALYSSSVEHALATCQVDNGLKLVYQLFAAWKGVSQRSTVDRWMNELLARVESPSRIRAMVLRRQAILASEYFGDDERTARLLDASEADAIAVSDDQVLGMVRATRAGLDLDRGRLDGVEIRLRDAIVLLEQSGGEYVANALTSLAELYMFRAQFDQADEQLIQAAAANPFWYQRVQIEELRAWCALFSGRIESAASLCTTTLDMAERTGDPDLICDAIEVAAYAALARGETALAGELFVRMVTQARDHDLLELPYALVGLAIVSALRGDLAVARSCRDEFLGRDHIPTEIAAHGHLACAFVDFADGDADKAAAAATDVLELTKLSGQTYAHVLSLELVAACTASNDPRRARNLLAAADHLRTEVGAIAWPLEPYRHVALRTLGDLDPV